MYDTVVIHVSIVSLKSFYILHSTPRTAIM